MSRAPRPVLSLAVSNSDPIACDQSAPEQEGGSLGNQLSRETSALDGRPVDPYRFKTVFPDQWSAFLRAHHRRPEEVAVFYGVTFRTAENWWHGVTAGSGASVAQAALAHPDAFAAHFSGKAA